MVTKKVFLIVVSVLFLFNIATFICMSVRLGNTEVDNETQVNSLKDVVYVFLAEYDVKSGNLNDNLKSIEDDLDNLEISLSENMDELSLIHGDYQNIWNNFDVLFSLHAGEYEKRWVKTPDGPTLLLED